MGEYAHGLLDVAARWGSRAGEGRRSVVLVLSTAVAVGLRLAVVVWSAGAAVGLAVPPPTPTRPVLQIIPGPSGSDHAGGRPGHGRPSAVSGNHQLCLRVTGALSPAATTWQSSESLGYGSTYRIAPTAVGADGISMQQSSTIDTLSPAT